MPAPMIAILGWRPSLAQQPRVSFMSCTSIGRDHSNSARIEGLI
jgi:hypothetical protein